MSTNLRYGDVEFETRTRSNWFSELFAHVDF